MASAYRIDMGKVTAMECSQSDDGKIAASADEPAYPIREISAVVLAGGRARRMGGQDKGLVALNNRPMVEYIVQRIAPQVGSVLISANRNLEIYGRLGDYRVIPDGVGEFAGPLAGMASALQVIDTRYLLTVPCDSPLLCDDLACRLYDALHESDAQISVACDGERLQPVFNLLRRDVLTSLLAYLDSGERKIDRWYALHRTASADFSDRSDMFLNINTPEERAQLERRLAGNDAC